jgi:hypothetical protein
MGFQNNKNFNFENFGTLDLRVCRKMTFGCNPVVNHREYYNGEGGGLPPSFGRGESCEFMYAHDSFIHQKCFNYAITNLLFGLCRFM